MKNSNPLSIESGLPSSVRYEDIHFYSLEEKGRLKKRIDFLASELLAQLLKYRQGDEDLTVSQRAQQLLEELDDLFQKISAGLAGPDADRRINQYQ